MRRPGAVAQHESNHGFGHVLFGPSTGFFLGRPTNLTNHDHKVGVRSSLKSLSIRVIGPNDGVTANPNASGLPNPNRAELADCLVGQGAASGHNAHASWGMNVARHDSNLALAWGDDAWTVGADHPTVRTLHVGMHAGHVVGRNPLRDRHNQLDSRINSLTDRIRGEGGGTKPPSHSRRFPFELPQRYWWNLGLKDLAAFAWVTPPTRRVPYSSICLVKTTGRPGDAITDQTGVVVNGIAMMLPKPVSLRQILSIRHGVRVMIVGAFHERFCPSHWFPE